MLQVLPKVALLKLCSVNFEYLLGAEYSEDEEDDDDLAQEFLPSPRSASTCPSPGLSLLSLSVSVDTARLSMLLQIKENERVHSQITDM